MAYQRKCANWLETFAEWTIPRGEAPLTFVHAAGIFTLCSVLRRNVKIAKETMGSYEIVPNLYVIFVGPAGGPRKTTTVDYSVELLARLPQIKRAADLTSKESLVDELLKAEGCAITVIAGELGEFFAKSGPEMFGTLTNLFDAKRDLNVATLTRGTQFGEKPCLNLIGATTPEWIAGNMPESVIGGGFASRVIFVFEETVRRRQLYFRHLNHEELHELYIKLSDDLQHIAGLTGNYEIDKEASEFMEDWYQNMQKPSNNKLHGYWNRRHVHAHKIALAIKASYSDEKILTLSDFQKAIEFLLEIEIKLPSVFLGIGKNKFTIDAKYMALYLYNKKKVLKSDMLREFYSIAEPAMLETLLNSLIAMDYVKLETEWEDEAKFEGKKEYFVWIGGEG